MVHNIDIDKSKHSKAALTVLNCFLKLTDRELDIIATIVDNNIVSLNRVTKGVIMKSIKIDNYGLNNYLLKLRNKGYIVNNKLSDKLIEACKDKQIIINLNYTKNNAN